MENEREKVRKKSSYNERGKAVTKKKKRGIQKEIIKNQSHLERKGEDKATRKKDTRQAVGEKEMKKVEYVRKRERKKVKF